MQSADLSSLVRSISYRAKDRTKLFLSLAPKKQVVLLRRLSRHVQAQLITDLSNDALLALLEQCDPDRATDILQFLPKKRQNELISQLNEYYQHSVALLLQFDPQTAAGLMSLNYIQVESSETVGAVIEQLKVHEQRTGKLPTILVLSEGKVTGYLSFSSLAFAPNTRKIAEYVKKTSVIRHSADYKKVIKLFKKAAQNKVVVLSENDAVMGVIYAEDMLRLIEEQGASSLYTFAGVSQEETAFDSARRKFKFRYKWLLLNLATAFLSSFVVGLFDSTIAKNVLLAVYMPIVAGMGGNAGTQTLAVMVRSLSDMEFTKEMVWRTLQSEVGAGAVNGVLNGIVVAAIVLLFNRNPLVAVTLGFAMVSNLIVSATFGTLVPVVMKKLGKDPASSATIFITTATDVLGFMAFLGLAKVLLT